MIRDVVQKLELRGHLLSLGFGAVGGALFFWMKMPLAWMMGAMIFVTVAALLGLQPYMARRFRAVMVSILGVFLGSAFSPDVIGQLGQWSLALGVLLLFILCGSLIGYVFLRRVGGFSPVDAYFSSAPGGLSEMALAADDPGGSMRTVSLVHTVRVLCIIMLIPFWFRWVVGADVPSIMPDRPGAPAEALDWIILVGCAVLGWPLAKLCRLPAAALVGPMILSAIAHLTAMTHVQPPAVPVAAAQLVLGAAVGCRFAGSALSDIWRIARLALGTTAMLLTLAVIFTLVFSPIIGVAPSAMILVLSPGGLAEMSLIALAIGIDTAFVSTMHMCRIIIIIIGGPTLFRVWNRRFGATNS